MPPFARLRDVVPSAYLRVFQPLDGFERQEQVHWERYLVEGARSPSLRRRYADHETTEGLGVLAPAEGEHAEVRVIDGRTFVSPWRMHLRVLAALLSFSATKPLELSDRFVPKQDAKRAAKELAKLRRRDPAAVAFVHQSPWHVPIRWFVLFDDGERWLGEDEFGRTRLRYRTTARRAMRRAERAVPVLRRTDLGPISELILDLHQWLAGVRSGVAPGARLRDALRLHDVGRAGRRSVVARSARGARRARARRVPAVGGHLSGRPDALGRDPQPRDHELACGLAARGPRGFT